MDTEILLVEDNSSDDAQLTLRALPRKNLANHIPFARDGEEALDFLSCREARSNRRCGDAPRLVLLDLKLPKIGRLDVLQAVKADPRTRAIPVAVLTSSQEERDLVSSCNLGVNSYIQKPVNLVEFQEVVRQLGMYWLFLNSASPTVAVTSA